MLADEKLFVVDSALRKSDMICTKVHDFSINEWSGKKEGALHSIAVVSKKKEAFIVFWNKNTQNYEESRHFNISELPSHLGYNGSHLICSYKKEYETYNVEKNFAMARGPI